MKSPRRIVIACVISAILAGCAYIPPTDETPQRRISPDYILSSIYGREVRAYLYGNKTVLEFAVRPLTLAVRDENGVSVEWQRVGDLIRLNRALNAFTAYADGQPLTFVRPPVVQLFSGPADPEPEPVPAMIEEPDQGRAVAGADELDAPIRALLDMATQQRRAVRALLEASEKEGPKRSSALLQMLERLEVADKRRDEDSSETISIAFDYAKTDYIAPDDMATVLVPAAVEATEIRLRGFTDSRRAGRRDASIALARATTIKRYLVANGIRADKITISGTSENEFAAPYWLSEGRAVNRRVEVTFIHPRITEIQAQAPTLPK